MGRLVRLVGVLAFFVSGNAFAEVYYSVSVSAIPAGPVPTAAFSFHFHSADFLVPILFFNNFAVENEAGFALNGNPIRGFTLENLLLRMISQYSDTMRRGPLVSRRL
jgi:hypothetical protein